MPKLVVPGSWSNVTSGELRSELPGSTLGDVLKTFVRLHPKAGYRLYSSEGGETLRYHLIAVDGQLLDRNAEPEDVMLGAASTVEIIAPLSGG